MSMSDLWPSGPDPAAPLRQLLLDGLADIIAEFCLETIHCQACRASGGDCPGHQADAVIAEDCLAIYRKLTATAGAS